MKSDKNKSIEDYAESFMKWAKELDKKLDMLEKKLERVKAYESK